MITLFETNFKLFISIKAKFFCFYFETKIKMPQYKVK